MRIISGYLGGRQFESPHGHRTHPMSDKIRGALFNTLGDISGLTFLDAFAGTGAISFEAISRGAASAVAVEADKRAHMVIDKNIDKLELHNRIKATRAFMHSWSNRHKDLKFDIVVADPPHDNLPFRDLKALPQHLKSGGIIVLCWPGKAEPYYLPGFTESYIKNYGDAQLVFYRKTE